MEFRLLGPLEVAEDGRTVSLGGSRASALFALLLLHRNEVLAIDRIVEELWPDRPPKTGGQVVRVYVSHLRKALEPNRLRSDQHQVLLTRRNGYVLRVDNGQLDVDLFETLREDGRRLLADGESAEAAARLEKGLSLWRGPPLQDFAYESFAQPEIARLEELQVATLEDLFEARLAAGRDSDLVADLEQLVEAHPLRERLRAQLMLALYRGGRPADSLETYQRGRRYLAEELGLEPGESLRQLEARILQQDPALDRPNVPRPPDAVAPPPTRSRRRARRVVAVVLVLLCAVAAAALLITARAGHSHEQVRVALVVNLPRGLSNTSPTGIGPITALRAAAKHAGVHTKVFYGGSTSSGFLREIRAAAETSDFVIVGATSNLDAVSTLTRQFPRTRFLVPGSVSDKRVSFAGQRNVTGLDFDDRAGGYLGGYLAGLMTHGDQKISAIEGARKPQRALVAGFIAGARKARPHVKVLVYHAGTSFRPAPCVAAVNRQIDHGSAVIFDAASECGFAALEAAVFRGVWGVAAETDLSWLGPRVLGSVVERTGPAIQRAVLLFAAGELPRGANLRFGLASGDIALVKPSPRIPPAILAKVAKREEQLLARDQSRTHN